MPFSISKSNIIGTYVNYNFGRICGPEISDKPDTLILQDNNKFISSYYGKGEYSVSGKTITLNYQYELGTAGFDASFEKTLFSKPRIILNYKLDCYYEKL